MDSTARKVTLGLIAKRCGVSKMTVSRVLRNEPNVSTSTREFVTRVAEKMGFEPTGCYHVNGRARNRGHYAILFQPEYSTKDAFCSGIIVSVQCELLARGLDCSLGMVSNDYREFLNLNRSLRSREVRGILVMGYIPPRYAEILQRNFLNLVFIDYPGDPGIANPYTSVCVENVHGAHLALNHLLSLGRKRILLISGQEGHYFSEALQRAYKETLVRHDLPVDSRLIANGDFHVESGFKATNAVLKAGVSFDAIFSNDEMACGAIRALKETHLRVPADVAVVGFDGLPIGEIVSPALTTVAVDRRRMGRLAVEQLLALDQEEPQNVRFEQLSIFPTLLVRNSCGAAISAAA